MSRAIVFGAGGLIGYHIARALVADGWQVSGVVRSQFDAQQLLLIGVSPLVGSAQEESTYETALAQASLVIDAGLFDISAFFQGRDPTAVLRKVFELSVKLTSPRHKKRFIITSGSATFKSQGDTLVDESSETNSFPATNSFEEFTKEACARTDIAVTVMAPSGVYGAWFGRWSLLFNYNKETKKIDFPGKTTKRISFIHVEDVASAYVTIANASIGSIAGEWFLIADDQRSTILQVWQSLAKAAGSSGEINFLPPSNQPDLQLLEQFDLVINTNKLKKLGWAPKHVSPLDNSKLLFDGYLAWKTVRVPKEAETKK